MTDQPAQIPAGEIVHRSVSWVLECGHRVTCNCVHVIGLTAYCWYCGNDQTVMSMEEQLYTSRDEKYHGSRNQSA